MKRAASDRRTQTSEEASSGVPMRPSACMPASPRLRGVVQRVIYKGCVDETGADRVGAHSVGRMVAGRRSNR